LQTFNTIKCHRRFGNDFGFYCKLIEFFKWIVLDELTQIIMYLTPHILVKYQGEVMEYEYHDDVTYKRNSDNQTV